MKTLNYKSFQINIHSTQTHNFLISNKDLAEVCYVYEKLLDQTRSLNPAILLEDQHYIVLEGIIYWTKVGIIRVIVLLSNVESLEFASYLEKDINKID